MKWTVLILVATLVCGGCMSAPREMAVMSDVGLAAGVMGREASRSGDLMDRERLIVRSATLRIEVDDPEEARERATDLAREGDGWIQEADDDSATVRIPDEGLDDYLKAVEGLGEVTYRRVHGEDVTMQYRDSRIRLENLERSHERYRELLTQAQDVGEALAVEKELERVVGEIEVLRGRLKHLSLQVSFATVSLRFYEGQTPGPLGWVWLGLYSGFKWLWVWE